MGRLKLLWDLYGLRRNAVGSKRKMEELQGRKMRHILRYAYEHSAFYHRTFEEEGITGENVETVPFHRFPAIDKDILMEHFDELVTVSGLKQEEIARFDGEQDAFGHCQGCALGYVHGGDHPAAGPKAEDYVYCRH